MTSEQLFDAVGQIDEQWIAEAAEPVTAQIIPITQKHKKKHTGRIIAGVAAAAAAIVIALPNLSPSVAYAWEKVPVLRTIVKVVVWRDYQVEEGRHEADISVPQVKVEPQDQADDAVKEQLQQSAEHINATVEQMTDQIIAEFEDALRSDPDMQGADSIHVGHEVVTDNDRYFCLKVWNLEVQGSGYEQDYYYTIDRQTGKEVSLADLFADDSYIQTISEEIKRQMREQMAADENKQYWLDDPEAEEWNFDQIAADQSFYITDKGALVICFNEGDVAPMYMGCVSFEMPDHIWNMQND